MPPVLCQLGCGLFIFPHGLVNEKITVAITGALSGSVLLASVNAQLGGVGYAIAAEYVFYIFFALCLLCTLSVLASERLRVGGRPALAIRVEIVRARYICLQFAVRLWRRALLPLGGKR